MTKQNATKAAQAPSYRQRAAQARDAAGRFIKRSATVEAASTHAEQVAQPEPGDDDLHAVNDLSNTERVGLRTNDTVRREGDTITIELPPVSWTAVSIG